MSLHKSKNVFVHHRRTGHIDVRRANEFSKRHASWHLDHALHYVGTDRARVCRCQHPTHHYEKIIPVASESTHLDAALRLYMDRHGLESCSVADFHEWKVRRDAAWAKDGVCVDQFHYTSKAKDVVCRCHRPSDHAYGAPRNPQIIEQCAEFFELNQDKMSCTSRQWRSMHGDTPPAYSPDPVSPIHDSMPTTDHFQYQSSKKGLSPRLQEMRICSTAERVAPVDMQHLRGGPRNEPDIPESVWQHARPSVCIPRRESDTAVSTPLGTSLPPFDPLHQQKRSTVTSRVRNPDPPRPTTTSTNWSDVQRRASVSDDEPRPTYSRLGVSPLLDDYADLQEKILKPTSSSAGLVETARDTHDAFEYDNVQLPRGSGLGVTMSDPFANEWAHTPLQTPVAELPGERYATELQAEPAQPKHRHTATLRELEGPDRPISVEKFPQRESVSSKLSVSLSSLFQQIHDIVRLPSQEEFLLRHVVISSRANPPPVGNCNVCKKPYKTEHNRTFMLPDCGHFLHEACLISEFRTRDQQVGTCPICQLGLCERTLADRIDTDRRAIFGSTYTKLHNEISIEFPQRSEAVRCVSEQELAAAQLRLLKDYIDVHAEELFRQFEVNRAEPDWYTGVIRPATKLLRGWNLPVRQCRYIADREAFIKLVAWAELVRLMNVTQALIKDKQGIDTSFPQLAQLHKKFMWAKQRYDKEKRTWQTNRVGTLECEKLVQNMVNLAMSTYAP